MKGENFDGLSNRIRVEMLMEKSYPSTYTAQYDLLSVFQVPWFVDRRPFIHQREGGRGSVSSFFPRRVLSTHHFSSRYPAPRCRTAVLNRWQLTQEGKENITIAPGIILRDNDHRHREGETVKNLVR